VVDVKFTFTKAGYETLEVTKTVHDLSKMQAFFPTRITFDTPFDITVQDMDARPVEGVELSYLRIDSSGNPIGSAVTAGTTDHNGVIRLLIPKNSP